MSSPVRPGTSTAKCKVLSLKVKRAILDEVRQKSKKTDTAWKYDIAQSTLATITKNASKIDAVLDDDVGSGERKQIRTATYDDVEAVLYKWLVDAHTKNVPLSGPILLAKAGSLGVVLGHDNLNPGNG
ncbi:hypothetical protein HPB49_011960 [Dermacentor silvarum]|uniref:Uncharacterized protein n=1 Tax=Dermacentor silvarum TaxID=543639 RepID=A0ACB8DZG3_DERSI|nr:hypothetical protein HPB49_011960 [Dermacentor silvarum]